MVKGYTHTWVARCGLCGTSSRISASNKDEAENLAREWHATLRNSCNQSIAGQLYVQVTLGPFPPRVGEVFELTLNKALSPLDMLCDARLPSDDWEYSGSNLVTPIRQKFELERLDEDVRDCSGVAEKLGRLAHAQWYTAFKSAYPTPDEEGPIVFGSSESRWIHTLEDESGYNYHEGQNFVATLEAGNQLSREILSWGLLLQLNDVWHNGYRWLIEVG